MSISEINFVDTDTNTIKNQVINTYEAITGTSLARAAPVRLFLEALADIIVQQRVQINYAAKMNLVQFATGDYLDALGLLVGCQRLGASSAVTTLKITLSASRPSGINIPEGTRVATADNVVFATTEAVLIPSGELEAIVGAECVAVGAVGNTYEIGEIKNIVDPIAYVAKMENITMSEGGADTESDDDFRERIILSPERFTVAGSSGAYEYHTKQVSTLIGDVAVVGPPDVPDGHVDVYTLMKDGTLPGEELQQEILEALNKRTVRPITDYVSVKTPEVIHYDIELVYYISVEDSTSATAIRKAVENAVAEFALWQKQKMGRDINPSKLIRNIIMAGAKRAEIISPKFTKITSYSVAAADNITVHYGGLEDE